MCCCAPLRSPESLPAGHTSVIDPFCRRKTHRGAIFSTSQDGWQDGNGNGRREIYTLMMLRREHASDGGSGPSPQTYGSIIQEDEGLRLSQKFLDSTTEPPEFRPGEFIQQNVNAVEVLITGHATSTTDPRLGATIHLSSSRAGSHAAFLATRQRFPITCRACQWQY